ncbi:hypothetical protein BDV97DRAFT_358746 [Delphinella strobiligena]|nr:hypothetical protein BDV97DRAFT_358746 [Delphinella strobiligena]
MYLRANLEVVQRASGAIVTVWTTTLTHELAEILEKTWAEHLFVGYQTIALMAIKADQRTGGEHYQYALKYKTKAWSLAAKEWAKPTKDKARALYIYIWFDMIVAMEISHYSKTDKQFAIQVSRALEVFANMYKSLVPLVEEMFDDASFNKLVKFSPARKMTEAELQADPVVKAVYKVIKAKAGDAHTPSSSVVAPFGELGGRVLSER